MKIVYIVTVRKRERLLQRRLKRKKGFAEGTSLLSEEGENIERKSQKVKRIDLKNSIVL